MEAPLQRSWLPSLLTLTVLATVISVHAADEPIDWERARQLHQRTSRGEKLSPAEQAYYDRARQERMRNTPGGNIPNSAGGTRPVDAASPRTTTGLKPLTELGNQKYKEQDGGLYGNGKNVPPPAHAELLVAATRQITPRNQEGLPATNGRIAVVSIGMSNTTQEFSKFKQLSDADPQRSAAVVLVDGAQGGQTGLAWSGKMQRGNDPWAVLDERVRTAGVTAAQVQVAWLKMAEAGPAMHGNFPGHTRVLQDSYATVLPKLRERFPNLQIAFLSSRIYAGYATNSLNPEPFAYESAYAVRGVIQQQIDGDAALNADAQRGSVVAPVVAWGPYLWANGMTARAGDQLVWAREDFAGDGTHPSESGRDKVARLLLDFFRNDSSASRWYLASTN